MQDSVELAAEPVNTQYNSAHGGGGVLTSGDWVDHIFVSKDFEVLGWKQLVRLSASR